MDLINILFAKALNNGDTEEYVDEAIKALKGEVNADLDTLEELSKALGNDPDFFLSVKNELDKKITQEELDATIAEIVTDKDSATDNTRFAIGTAEQTLEVPSMEEFNELKDDVAAITPDDTVVDGKPWTSKKIVDSLCSPLEASGNPVQVYPVENYPLGVKVSWEPVQEGSGDPSQDNIRPITGRDAVSVTRCGKNLLDFSSFTNYTNWRMDIAAEGDAPTVNSNKGYILPVKPSKTYTISFEFLGDTFTTYLYIVKSINGVSELYKYITTNIIQNKVVSFTPADNEIWYLRMGSTDKEDIFNAQIENITYIQLELGDTDTSYEPYTGDTYTAELPETIYGGELDWNTGVLTVDRGITIADGTVNKFNPDATGKYWNMPMNSSPGMQNTQGITNSHLNKGRFWLNGNNAFIYTTNIAMEGLFNTTEDLNAYLVEQNTAGTPVTFVYELKTPYTIQLTPQEIAALSGVNTLYTDAGTLTVTGREDPRHTIVELKNAIISLGGNI